MIPTSIQLGPLIFHLYGLILGMAAVLGMQVTSYWGGKQGANIRFLERGILLAIFLGVMGARTYHVWDKWNYYQNNLDEIFYLWQGGLGIFGAVIGGVLGLWLTAQRYKQPVGLWIDLAAFGLIVGQIIGRLGNYVNQELYGKPTDLPWGIYISTEYRVPGAESYSRFHPLFLYESLLMIVGLALMWSMAQRKKLVWGKGLYAAIYLICYGLVRLVLENLRMESWKVGIIPVASLWSVGFILSGALWLLIQSKK